MKRIIAIALLLIVCITCLSSCGIIDYYEESYTLMQEADAISKVFTSALAEGNFEKAMACVHPESELTIESLEELMTSIFEEHGIKFPQSARIKQLSMKPFKMANDTVYHEDTLTIIELPMSYKVVIGGIKFTMEARFLNNENGFGILTYTLK